jgi:hypothetical protein
VLVASLLLVTAASGIVAPQRDTIAIRYTRTAEHLSPLAIGMAETGYSAPNALATDVIEQQRIRKLRMSVIRMDLVYTSPGDPTSKIVCGGAGCDTGPAGDDWIGAIKSVGAQPLVIVSTRSSVDASNLVAHFNVNPSTGRPDPSLPHYVRYWLVGNEPNFNGYSASSYSDYFNRDYDAMKAVDPGIEVGGPAIAGYDAAWLAEFLTLSGTRVDFLDFHGYAQEGCSTCTPTAPQKLFDWARKIGNDVGQLHLLVSRLVPARAGHIAIEVGEWSLDSGGSLQTYSNLAAVWTADVLGHILESGGRSIFYGTKGNAIKMWPGDITSDEGKLVHMSRDDYQAAAHGYGMFTGESLFRPFGTRLVRSSTRLRDVDVFASDNPKNIVVVNRSQTAGHDVTFSVGALSGKVAVWQKNQQIAFTAPPVPLAGTTVRDGRFSYYLPPLSVTTFVLNPSSRTAEAAVTSAQAQPETGR